MTKLQYAHLKFFLKLALKYDWNLSCIYLKIDGQTGWPTDLHTNSYRSIPSPNKVGGGPIIIYWSVWVITYIPAKCFILTLSQTTNLRRFQDERVCRQQFQTWWKWQEVLQMSRKHRGKKRNCSLRAKLQFLLYPKYFQKTCIPTRKNQGLFGKELTGFDTNSFHWDPAGVRPGCPPQNRGSVSIHFILKIKIKKKISTYPT